MVYYVCKYTPIELFAGFGVETAALETMPEDFSRSDGIAHANLCGFGKSVMEAVLAGTVQELVLVNCCDCMRRVYDLVKKTGRLQFLYLLDLPHETSECEVTGMVSRILALKEAYAAYSGRTFDWQAFAQAFRETHLKQEDYVGILGVRAGEQLSRMIAQSMPYPVRNETCIGGRALHLTAEDMAAETKDAKEAAWTAYAAGLLGQIPCMRMADPAARRQLYLDPHLKGIIYHTIKFCDFYGFEYANMKNQAQVPVLKLETDFTSQSIGQLSTRIEAFAETLGGAGVKKKWTEEEKQTMIQAGSYYVAGIDSGSTSTDVVIMDGKKQIVTSLIIPTGGGAALSAEKCLAQALDKAGLRREDIQTIVTTGYGRAYIASGDESITEITCHARGAHYLNPSVRTIIDIGGQDSKAIRVDAQGAVKNFLMNDKCAAGTGRFLEMMARTLGISLEEMSLLGLDWKEDIVISSMCTVFAESEVVSLVAQNRALPDIIHGLNNSVASKVAALAGRLGQEESYILTGGVARNKGIIKALEEKMNVHLYICEEAQICGAIGAALFALER